MTNNTNMKNWLSMVAAAMIGGVVTVGGVTFVQNQQAKKAEISASAKQVNFLDGITGGPVGGVPDFTTAAATAVDAVVHIKTTESEEKMQREQEQMERQNPFAQFFGGGMGGLMQPKAGTGSGVIINTDGYIVTNNHVIEFGDEFQVTLNDNRQYKAKLVGRAPEIDLAVLKIEADKLVAMPYGNSDVAKVGQWVLAVGNPFDLTSTVTAGIISAKGRGLDRSSRKLESYIQTDAPVNPGNSGGALVDASTGKLIGINTAIMTHTGSYEGYSFAIPVNLMTKVVDDIIKHGSYQRGYLGVNISDLDDETAKELDVNVSKGVVVDKLIAGGSARSAGVQVEDVIVKVNGQDVKNGNELMEKVATARVGDVVNLTIVRGSATKEIPVKLKGMNPKGE
jgi:Do/DeqQ family serine protease